MDYKIGDTIRIKPIEWYEDNKDENGIVVCYPQFYTFVKSMNKYCGKNAVITSISDETYRIDIDSGTFYWTDEMFEEKFDFKNLKIGDTFNLDGKEYIVKQGVGCDLCAFNHSVKCNERNLPKCSFTFRKDKKSVIFVEVKNKTMDSKEERDVKINFSTAKKWYNGNNENLKTIALQAFTVDELEDSKLPKSWGEFCAKSSKGGKEYFIDYNSQIISTGDFCTRDSNTDRNVLPNKADAEGILALCQLTQLRDCYRQGWKPDWEDSTSKYIIDYGSNELRVSYYMHSNCFLSFQSTEIRDKFLNNFRDLIEQAKEYI